MESNADLLPEVLCLGGPTGSGKTSLAIALASELNGEIINADSRQVYSDFPILTAQPGRQERCGIPHHLYGFMAADANLSAARWASLAAEKCLEVIERGRLPILVGGTGFYFEALLGGLAEIPPVPEEIAREVAAEMAEKGSASMHRELSGIDPPWAAKIHPHDTQRIMRGLEVWRASGKTLSEWHRQKRKPLARGATLVLDIPLPSLVPGLEHRIHQMLAGGAREEVLAAAGKYPAFPKPGFSSLGCAEIISQANGEISSEECIRGWLAGTRAYAKRQLTWFRGRGRGIMLPTPHPGNAMEALKSAAPRNAG